jgi:hypothetical protein
LICLCHGWRRWSRAMLLLAPSGYGELAYDELVATRATWFSNWGQAGGPVADYVARVSWPGTAARK